VDCVALSFSLTCEAACHVSDPLLLLLICVLLLLLPGSEAYHPDGTGRDVLQAWRLNC
jgi:hypothetical protein